MNIIKLLKSSDLEPVESWSGLCNSPNDLLGFIIERIYGKIDTSFNDIILSDKKPEGEDRKKIWIKTTEPYAIGVLIDGEWRLDYGLSGYPENIPFLHKEINLLVDGLIMLESADITKYGLTDTVEGATDRMRWYLFTPPSI